MCPIKYLSKHWLSYLLFIPVAIAVFGGIFAISFSSIMFFANDVNAWIYLKWGSISLFSGLFLSQLELFKPITDFHCCHVDSPKGTWATMRSGHVMYQSMGRK